MLWNTPVFNCCSEGNCLKITWDHYIKARGQHNFKLKNHPQSEHNPLNSLQTLTLFYFLISERGQEFNLTIEQVTVIKTNLTFTAFLVIVDSFYI